MHDGNTADSQANRWSIQKLAEVLPEEHEVTIVGDSKLVDAGTLGHLMHEQFHFVSLVPLTFAVRTALVEEVRQAGPPLPELARKAGKKKADPDLLYRGASFRREMKVLHPLTGEARQEELTLVVVQSDAQQLGFDNKLEKLLLREEKSFRTALKKANKRKLRCREDAEAARDIALRTLELCRCEVEIVEEEVVEKRSGPGRPKKGEVAPTHVEYTLAYDELERDDDAVARARFHAAHYVLVSDRADWDAARILAEYREQSMIEGVCGFRWLKSIVDVAPVMLKTPHRISAVGLVFVLAMMVRNYLQFELRRKLEETDTTVRGRKVRVRTKKPTAETSYLSFQHLRTMTVRLGGQLIKRQVDPLSEDARTILSHLSIPIEVFGLPFEKWPPLASSTSGT